MFMKTLLMTPKLEDTILEENVHENTADDTILEEHVHENTADDLPFCRVVW